VPTVHLVRHGQASMHLEDYDQLSSLGEDQARRLGTHLAPGEPPDAIFVGRLKRHVQTVTLVTAAARAAGARWPEPKTLAELDEMPFQALWAACMREWKMPAETRPNRALFARALRAWVDGFSPSDAGCEPIDVFTRRIGHALEHLSRAGERVLAITSAGPIAFMLRSTGAVDGIDSAELVLGLRNSSLTRLRHDGARWLAEATNDTPHLPDELVTYV
jgi:broad specificity phosphatase PhoE